MNNLTEHLEVGTYVPYDQINPETLRHMVVEFVTCEWSPLTDDGFLRMTRLIRSGAVEGRKG